MGHLTGPIKRVFVNPSLGDLVEKEIPEHRDALRIPKLRRIDEVSVHPRRGRFGEGEYVFVHSRASLLATVEPLLPLVVRDTFASIEVRGPDRVVVTTTPLLSGTWFVPPHLQFREDR